MKTPKQFNENLKNKIITEEMLELCLYSVNKRAKNCRDQIRKYKSKYRYNIYSEKNIKKYERKKQLYYKQKEKMLALLTPDWIHRVVRTNKYRIRWYDYEPEYKTLNDNNVIHENSFYDDYYNRVVYFKDELITEKKEELYLFYQTKHFSFHQPIVNDNLKKYGQLKRKTINLVTEGHDVNELISVQFITKLIELIDSNDYKYIKSN